jgi:two-component system sensor histidine kinase DesK
MATADDMQIVDTAPNHEAFRARDIAIDRPVPFVFWLFITVGVLLFLFYPLRELLRTHLSAERLFVALTGMVIFVSIYLWLMLREPFRVAPLSATEVRTHVLLLMVITVDVLFLTLAYSSTWLWFVLYANCAAGMKLPVRAAGIIIPAATLLTLGVTAATRGAQAINPSMSTILSVSVLLIGVSGMLATIQELRAARHEIGRLAAAEAVAEERLRFARDLHDLLGHSLSLIVLKSELAEGLQGVNAERAIGEIRDVKSVAREALHEVREAVAGYRQPTLATELPGARVMLATAGIACTVKDAAGDLPPAIDSVLAWTVREGVTNVIRHSGARHCTIAVRRTDGVVSAEVMDNGSGSPGLGETPLDAGRNGLTGLAERAAANGGCLDAGPRATGGFRLRVSLPLDKC